MALTKKILLELGLDDKKAEAVLKKFREEAKKPVKMELDIDVVSLDNAMVALNKFFTQLQKGLGKEKGFEVLSQSLIKVSENIEKVINASKEMTAINVNPLGLDEATKQIREIADTLRDMAKIKPEGNFFTNVEGHLREIQVLVNSIMEGLNFDKIRPSKMVEQEIAKAKSALKKIEDPNRTKTSIEEYFALDDKGRNQKTIPKIGKSIVADNESVQGVVSNGETEKLKALLSYMKDYVKLGGQLKDLQAGIKGVNLEDVFNKLRVDETLGSDEGIKNAVKELQYYLDLQAKIPKLQEELQVAQARENRDITATFDTKSVESFATAIKSAVSELKNLDIKIPEGTQITGFSEEQLNGLINKLGTISDKLVEIHTLMQNAFDTSKLQAEINEGINKTPIKINVEPELTDPAGFVGEIEKQLAGHKVKLGIDLTEAQKESSEATEKVSLSDLSGTIGEIQQKASTAADAVERITKKTSNGEDASYDDFKRLSEVLDHLKTSLDNINVEKLNSLSDIFTKLSGKNKLDERIESICNSIVILKETLDKPSGASGFIQELNTLASQGESLKDLTAVLKASKKQIEKAKDATTKKPVKKKEEKSIDVAQTRERLESTLDEKSIEGLGKFSQSDIKKNGSAILTFVDELEGKVVTTKVKVLDLNEALDKVASNKLSAQDYEILNQKSRDRKQQSSADEKVTIRDSEMEKINKGFSDIRNGANSSVESVKELTDYLGKQSAALAKNSAATDDAAQSEKRYAEAVKEATTASAKGLVGDFDKDYKRLEEKSTGKIPEYSEKLGEMKKQLDVLNGITSAESFDIFAPGTLEQITGITTQLKPLNDELKQTKKYTSVSDSKITGLQKQMATWELKNGKALSDANVRKQFDDLYKGLKNGIPESEFDRIQAGFNKIVSSASKAGKTGKTFFEGWKSRMTSLAQYLTTFASFYDVINVLRQGIQVIRDLDTAFVEMQKVSNDSLSSLKEFAQESFALGDSVGTTGQQMQKSAADWMRKIFVPLYGNI